MSMLMHLYNTLDGGVYCAGGNVTPEVRGGVAAMHNAKRATAAVGCDAWK